MVRLTDIARWAPRTRLAVAAVVAATLIGCGGAPGGDSSEAAQTAAARLRGGLEGQRSAVEQAVPHGIGMTAGLTFEPAQLTVPRGATVVWHNDSALPHTATADPAKAQSAANVQLPEDVQPFDSGTLNQGQSFSQQFPVAGTYRYVCTIHEASGMIGTLTVE